jgi:hypothetical protein
MKNLLWACVLALPLLALPAEAKAFGGAPFQIDVGAKAWCNVRWGPYGGMPQAGPWYLYWPYEAHFLAPAPGVSPFFPPPMTLPPGFGQPPAPMPHVPQGYAPPVPPGGMQPAGYSYYGR